MISVTKEEWQSRLVKRTFVSPNEKMCINVKYIPTSLQAWMWYVTLIRLERIEDLACAGSAYIRASKARRVCILDSCPWVELCAQMMEKKIDFHKVIHACLIQCHFSSLYRHSFVDFPFTPILNLPFPFLCLSLLPFAHPLSFSKRKCLGRFHYAVFLRYRVALINLRFCITVSKMHIYLRRQIHPLPHVRKGI